MKPIYENINTFSDEIYKSDLREKILNPLIVQHNRMSLDVTNHDTRLDAIEAGGGVGGGATKFEDLTDVPTYEANKFLKVNNSGDLEWSSVSTSGDEARFEAIEIDVVDLKAVDADIQKVIVDLKAVDADHETRIHDLEVNGGGGSGSGASSFKELSDTPANFSGAGGKLVAVKSAANGLEFVDAPEAITEFKRLHDTPNSFANAGGKIVAVKSTADGLEFIDAPSGGGGASTFTELSDTPSSYTGKADHFLAVNSTATGLEFLPHTHVNVDGRQIEYTWDPDHLPASGGKTLTQEQVAQRSFFISATNVPESVLTLQLPGISDYNQIPTASQTPGGRMAYFTNTGAGTMVLDATVSGLKIVHGASNAVDTITIGPGKFVHLMAVCRSNGAYKNFHIIGAGDSSNFA